MPQRPPARGQGFATGSALPQINCHRVGGGIGGRGVEGRVGGAE
jgi:hypothetical protein